MRKPKDRRMIISAMPFPEDIEKAGFYAMIYARQPDAKLGAVHAIYMLFKDEEHGRKVFDIIRSWNEHKPSDFEENIKISFVEEEDGGYSVYIYKNQEKIIRKADSVDKKSVDENLILQNVFWRYFGPTGRTSFDQFKKTYDTGKIFLFSGAVLEDKKLKVFEDMTIEKNELYFLNRITLDKKSFEYQLDKMSKGKI